MAFLRPLRHAAILAAVPLAALLAPRSLATQPPEPTWHVDAAPFRLVVTRGAAGVVAEAPWSATSSSLTYHLADGTPHALTSLVSQSPVSGGTAYTVATDEPGRTAVVTVRTNPTGVGVDVQLRPATGVGDIGESFASAAGEHFLGSGERGDYVDLLGQAPSLAVNYGCAYLATPFYASTAGYGVYVPGDARGRFAFPATGTPAAACSARHDLAGCALSPAPGRTQLCMQSNELSYDVFAGSFAAVSSAYAAVTGRPALPPVSEFGLIKWRDVVNGPGEILDDIQQLQSRGIPIAWVELDNPWEPGCVGRLTFDPARIPDPAGLIRQVHTLGVRFMLWVSPMATCWDAYPSGQTINAVTGGAYPEVNFENATALATFQQRLRALLALGVDGFKADRGADFDPGAVLNRYPLEYARAVMQVAPAAAAIFQTGVPGSQSVVPGVWAGDQPGAWIGLQRAIRMAQTAGVSGFPIWGSDTGGYSSVGETPDVFVRWAQLSAVSPVFEVGGIGENATFWQWGDATAELLRQAAVLHYELFPYLYGLAQAASQTGVPILRPLGYQFPSDRGSWSADLELMVGPSLLAAPVTASGTTPSVYLPPGAWVDLFAGSTVTGPSTGTRQTPLSQFPLYLRRGAIIPFDFRDPQLWPQPWGVDDLGHPGRAGWLYAPAPGRASAAGVGVVDEGGTITVAFTGSTRERELLLVGVRVRRASVPHVAAAALRSARAGWAISPASPFPGVVVKVAPGARTVTVQTAG